MDRDRQFSGHPSVEETSGTCLFHNSLEYSTTVQGRQTRGEKKRFSLKYKIMTSLSILIWQCRGSLSSLWLKFYLKKLKLINHNLLRMAVPLCKSLYGFHRVFLLSVLLQAMPWLPLIHSCFITLESSFVLWNVYLYKCKLAGGGMKFEKILLV